MKRGVIKLISKLITLIGPFISVILLAVVNGVIGYLLAINITLFAGIAILKFLGIAISLSYPLIFTIIILSGILRGIVRYFEQYSNHYIAFKILAILRIKIFRALRHLSLDKLEDKSKGDLVSLLQGDIETLEVFYAHTITPVLIALLTSVVMVIFMCLTTSIYLGLYLILAYLIIGVIIPVIFYKVNSKFGKKYRLKMAQFEDFYLDSIYGGYEIIANNKQEMYKKEVTKRSKDLIDVTKKSEMKNNTFMNITNSVIVILNILIIVIGYLLYKNNMIFNYEIILAYVVLTSSLGPVLALANLPSNLVQTFASGNRVLDILELKSSIVDGNTNISNVLPITFNKVSFKYDTKYILNNVNLTINKNEIVGILGPSGVGKSTILKLIMRFYDVSSGEVLINDMNIKNISYKSLYDNINLFSQSTYLFHDTILNNLLIAKSDASKEEVITACQNAGIYDYILAQKEGFNTKISDLKDNISEGEKQRLGLARVFLRKPKLLLLDEATANIDAINEGIILNALKQYSKDMSIIIISHRKSTLSICNKIYEFKEGNLCLV